LKPGEKKTGENAQRLSIKIKDEDFINGLTSFDIDRNPTVDTSFIKNSYFILIQTDFGLKENPQIMLPVNLFNPIPPKSKWWINDANWNPKILKVMALESKENFKVQKKHYAKW